MISFTAEVFIQMLAQYNTAIWPSQLIGCGLGLTAVLLVLRPQKHGNRWIAAFITASWLWTGAVFHIVYFSAINFTAPISGALFIAQALLIAWAGLFRGTLGFHFHHEVFGWTGVSLIIIAVAAFPLLDLIAGHGWQSIRVFAVAPGPLVVFTFGMLLLTDRRVPIHLLVIPALWAFVAGAAAWRLSIPQDLLLPPAAAVTIALALWKNRSHRRAVQLA